MRRLSTSLAIVCVLCAAGTASAQNVGDRLKQFMGSAAGQNSAIQQLPESQVISGLKAALARGAGTAVTQLGQTGGFWDNAARRIPLPGWMNNAASVLKNAGYGSQMNTMQHAMNRAAEQATAQAGPIVENAISQMSVQDARNILAGSDTAATDYLQSHTSDPLKARFEPIIAQTTAQSRAVNLYQSLTTRAKPMLSFLPGLDLNLNDYVTQQAMNGLFAVMGQQEKQIRQNPAERGTALLKKVFGAAAGS